MDPTREVCAFADKLSPWSQVVLNAIGDDGYSIHIPHLLCRLQPEDPDAWTPTGYGDTVEDASSNFMKKLTGFFVSYQHPTMEKPVKLETVFVLERRREAA